MRCPLCDQVIDQSLLHSSSEPQPCPICREIRREAEGAEQDVRQEEFAPALTAPAVRRTPGVEDAFNWY
jgi:hypothetical protein